MTMHGPLLPNMLTDLVIFLHHVCHGINKNREQMREIICLAMQQQKTSLRRDRHADFIRNRETGTSFKTLFRKKYSNMTKQCPAVGGRQLGKKCNMTLNQLQP